ncbi:PIN domain-containing protein [Streptomyces sp. NPDC052309]|uniref:PIN domain-containing protein n=1 Tax=Streptomyces sp. NPDC052309 TaxID=3155421 RepID=UPI0034302E5F
MTQPTEGAAAPTRRLIFLDANVFINICSGNASAARKLKELLTTADVVIPRQAYNELIADRDIQGRPTGIPTRYREARRATLEELGIRIAPIEGTMAARAKVYEHNITGKGMLAPFSYKDQFVAAQAAAAGAEVWSYDSPYLNNQRQLASMGVRVAPESTAFPMVVSDALGDDLNRGRALLGLKPLPGIPKLRPPGGGRGGAGGGLSGVPFPGGGGQPVLPPSGGTSLKTQALGVLQLFFQGVEIILNWGTRHTNERRIRAALARKSPMIRRISEEMPSMGILLVFVYKGLYSRESGLSPEPYFDDRIDIALGSTEEEAIAEHLRNRDRLPLPENPVIEYVFLPPRQPANISEITRPFLSVAIATWTETAPVKSNLKYYAPLAIQNASFTAFGFRSDDEAVVYVDYFDKRTFGFFVLNVPKRLGYDDFGRTLWRDIPVENRPAKSGGSIPAVHLDDGLWASCVFPADDYTDAVFTSPNPSGRPRPKPTEHWGRLRRYANFSKARWIRIENIRIISQIAS